MKTKAYGVGSSRPNARDEKEWQVAGARKKKEKTNTRERNPEKNDKVPQSGRGNNAQTRTPVTVIARRRAVPLFSYSPSRAERKRQAARKLAARKLLSGGKAKKEGLQTKRCPHNAKMRLANA